MLYFEQVYIPRYATAEDLRAKLEIAVRDAGGFAEVAVAEE